MFTEIKGTAEQADYEAGHLAFNLPRRYLKLLLWKASGMIIELKQGY
ncbi:hypothetical protein LGZ99_17045 [Photorhabdus temperata]|nr:hypothetical protein [Photorhabdus temperata]MCT8348845.1 hypothetical protein [Photorhabdus temperata]